MPVITVKLIEGELTWGETAQMVENITRAVSPFTGDVVRPSVWVLVEQVKSGPRGISATALGRADLGKYKTSAPARLGPGLHRTQTTKEITREQR